MRTLPRPAIGIVVSAAVAAAAIFAGMNFASPTSVTEDATVLAPSAIDGVPVPGDNDPETLDVSGGTGLARVVTPGSGDPDALPAGLEDAIAALDEAGAGDPTEGYLAPMGTGGYGGGGPDDPCAPESGDAPEDCPDGLHSAIFSDTMPPELEVWPVPDVATSPVGTSVYCPDLTPGEGELGLGVATSIPASVTVRYWPADNPADVRTVAPAGLASETAAWNARVAETGTYPVREFVFQHCGLLTGLSPHTDYVLSAVAIDDEFHRISDAVERRFSSDGQPTEPPMRAVPLGDHLLYVSVPNYGEANLPWVQAWVVAEGAPADCSSADLSHAALQSIQPQRVVTLTPEYLHAHNYATGYNRAVVDIYDVPEGSTVVVCARWFDRDAPVWDRDIPTKQKFIVAMSPDSIVPVVTVTRASFIRNVALQSIGIDASTASGLVCGHVTLPPADTSGGSTVDIGATLCDTSESDVSYLAPPGTGGNIVLSTAAYGGGEVLHSSYLLPLSHYECLGTCDLPPSLTYSIPLPTVRVGSGLCGSGFGGDCTPPTRETALGTVDVDVTWIQGNVNGLDHWVVGEADATAPDAPPPPDAPIFDTEAWWAVSLSTDGWRGEARAVLRSDRHVTYTATIAGDCFLGEAPAPVTGSTHRDAAGIEAASVSFWGLCPGGTYRTRVEMIDDAGHLTVADYSRDAGTVWWPGAAFTVPVAEIEISGTMTVRTDPSWYGAWWLVGSDIYVGPGENRTWADYGPSLERCFTRDVHSASGTLRPVRIDQSQTIHIRHYSRVTSEGLYYGVDHDTLCDWPGANSWVADIDMDIPFTDLLRGVTVEGDLWQRGFAEGAPGRGEIQYTLTLRATRVTD